MKYIRTKDGIYDTSFVSICKLYGIMYMSNDEVRYVEILKVADNIEELCDRYIVKNIVSRKYTIYTPKQYDRFKDRHILTYLDIKTGCKEVYGAIWTDKGLIYVAKMNEKGELELL